MPLFLVCGTVNPVNPSLTLGLMNTSNILGWAAWARSPGFRPEGKLYPPACLKTWLAPCKYVSFFARPRNREGALPSKVGVSQTCPSASKPLLLLAYTQVCDELLQPIIPEHIKQTTCGKPCAQRVNSPRQIVTMNRLQSPVNVQPALGPRPQHGMA